MKFIQLISDGTKLGIAVGVLHLLLIIAAYSSPFWLDWRVITTGVLILWIQYIAIGRCILNDVQYGSKDGRLYEGILTALGIKYDQEKLGIILNFVVPTIVLAIALIWQLALHFQVVANF
ncbi:MAG: hypothetical protein AAB774_02145 [Patescibacteria group bacterium]